MQIRGGFHVENNGVGLLLTHFTCTDATVGVARVAIATIQLIVKVDTCTVNHVALSQAAGPFGIFHSWHGPSQAGLFLFFIVNLGPLPENSGPNPKSFQFLTGGRLTLTQVLHLPPNLKTLATSMKQAMKK